MEREKQRITGHFLSEINEHFEVDEEQVTWWFVFRPDQWSWDSAEKDGAYLSRSATALFERYNLGGEASKFPTWVCDGLEYQLQRLQQMVVKPDNNFKGMRDSPKAFWSKLWKKARELKVDLEIAHYFFLLGECRDKTMVCVESFNSWMSRIFRDKLRRSHHLDWHQDCLRIRQNGPPPTTFAGGKHHPQFDPLPAMEVWTQKFNYQLVVSSKDKDDTVAAKIANGTNERMKRADSKRADETTKAKQFQRVQRASLSHDHEGKSKKRATRPRKLQAPPRFSEKKPHTPAQKATLSKVASGEMAKELLVNVANAGVKLGEAKKKAKKADAKKADEMATARAKADGGVHATGKAKGKKVGSSKTAETARYFKLHEEAEALRAMQLAPRDRSRSAERSKSAESSSRRGGGSSTH